LAEVGISPWLAAAEEEAVVIPKAEVAVERQDSLLLEAVD
jgi:hypothetical protein